MSLYFVIINSTSGSIEVRGGAVFNNLLNASFEVQNNQLFGVVGSSDGVFKNEGTVTKSISGGTAFFLVRFNNFGTVNVQSGRLSLAGGGTSTGEFATVAGTSVDFTGGIHELDFARITGPGFGTVAFDAVVRVGSFGVNVSNFAIFGPSGTVDGFGSLDVSGVLQWDGGRLLGGTVNANGLLRIRGLADKTLGCLLNNRGTATWQDAGNIEFGGGAFFINEENASFTAENSQTVFGGVFGAGTFSNGGTFTKAGSTGITTFFGIPFNNFGTVVVQSGRLSLAGDGFSTGLFTTVAGTSVDFTGGTHELLDGARITGPGFGRVGVGGFGSVEVNGTVTATNFQLLGGLGGPGILTVSGIFDWFAGTMSGTGATNADGLLQIDGAATKALNVRALNNSGTAIWTAGSILMSAGSTFRNLAGARFEVHNDERLLGSAGENFDNAGTFVKLAATGETSLEVPFTNTGSLEARRGTIRFARGFTQTAGRTLLAGGHITATDQDLDISVGEVLGSGTINGNAVSGGRFSPGESPGLINIVGNYTERATGSLSTEIAEIAAGQFDQLTVSNAASLAGTLNISLLNGFQPVVDDAFPILTYASRSGAFGTITGLSLPGGRRFEADLGADRLTLVTRGASGLADIAVTKTHAPEFPMVGDELTYTVTVTNNGPDVAMAVTVGDALPANVTFVSATPSQGTCSGTSIVQCDLGAINAMADATVTIVVRPTAIGAITNNVTVAADQSDPARANNRAMDTTLVNPADLSVTKAAAPEPVRVGENLTYTVVVTNDGPNPATGVRLSDTLPASVTFVSVSTTQGTCEQAGGTVTCNLEGLVVMGNATVTIVVQPTAAGTITNGVTVSADEPDQNTGNNTATRDSTVTE